MQHFLPKLFVTHFTIIRTNGSFGTDVITYRSKLPFKRIFSIQPWGILFLKSSRHDFVIILTFWTESVPLLDRDFTTPIHGL